nr:terminase gpA endonuclease subunit [Escherichia coli]
MGAGNSVPWDPLVAPYVIEPMNCLASREYDAVIFVGPARTGKTIGLIDGWVIYNVICDPADMLIIQMTEEKAREHSKKRLARTFRVSPEVVSRLSPNKNDNNVYDRTFLAGNYLKIGWPSVNIMSSSDYKCVALTDYDRFPEDIDGEGDAFSLASKRTTTFMSSGMTLVESSPGRDVKDVKWRRTSPHEAPPTTGILSLYNRGDRRRWYWPCPHCGEYFQPCGDVVAGFRDIADPVLASEAAYIQCPSCSGRIMPEQKRELNGRGVWLRDGESINADGSRYGDPRRSRIASFWMEGPAAAYQTLSQLVYKLLTAEQEYETTGSEETLKTVINTDWGLPYLPRASMEQRKSELLEQRAEPVPSRSVPDGVNFLVATVDVQAGRHRRFVVQVTGYGSRGERWIIDRYNITQSLRGDSDGESQRIDPASYLQTHTDMPGSDDLKGINVKYRYEFTDTLGLVTSFSYANAKDEQKTHYSDTRWHEDSVRNRWFSMMAGPSVRVNEWFSAYAMAGVAYSRVSTFSGDYLRVTDNKGKTHDVLTGSDDDRHSNTSLAWGAGVQFNPTESVAIDIAYEGSGSGDWRTDGFIVGVGYKF